MNRLISLTVSLKASVCMRKKRFCVSLCEEESVDKIKSEKQQLWRHASM